MQSLVRQNSHFVQYPFLSPKPVETDKCVSDVVASSQMIHQMGGCVHHDVIMSDADCTPGREPCSVAASSFLIFFSTVAEAVDYLIFII